MQPNAAPNALDGAENDQPRLAWTKPVLRSMNITSAELSSNPGPVDGVIFS